MRRLRGPLLILAAVAGAVFATDLACLARTADAQLNRTTRSGPILLEPRARELHSRLVVADLHADPLLWNRDLLIRADRGHVDVPRLLEGNIALQVFGIVTRVPLGQNMEMNPDLVDIIGLLSRGNGWPEPTHHSTLQRALAQSRILDETAAKSGGRLTVIRTREHLDAYLQRREKEPGITAGLLALEGAYPLEGELANLDRLFDAGVRMIGLSHFVDGDAAGSAHGWRKGGLTPLGRDLIAKCEERGITVDLAHASPLAFDDALRVAKRPVVISHTGVRATCDGTRNLSDAQIDAVARNGGVIGIAYFAAAVCGNSPKVIVDAIAHVARRIGVRHVGLGSDFDGAVTTEFDAAGVGLITAELLGRGFSDDEVASIMGGNVVRLLQGNLPAAH